jgi:hypothetical protein
LKKHPKCNIRKILSLFLTCPLLVASDLDMNAAINASYGNSYDFYTFSENRLDMNFFYNDLQGWIQYEYSNPPDVGFPLNDIRKFRVEYMADNFLFKLGDIYEFWGRGLLLNQFDDQVTNFDNGTRGLYLEYNRGPLSLSHINGNSDMWGMGADLRVPFFNNIHSMTANRLHYDWNSLSFGLTHLQSNEEHDKMSGPSAKVNHKLKGIYGSWLAGNADLFVEYVDKVSTEKISLFGTIPNDSLKTGHGIYGNLNLYLGNWGLSTEYKRYAFDAAHGDLTANDYGNQIEYQQTPTLGKEHNSTLLGRLTHNYNFNDERGVQVELNGSLLGLSVSAQYAHLSRNENWQSVTSYDWEERAFDSYLPSSDNSALPYWENYQEISGYTLNDRLYFKLGRGTNKEILKTTRYLDGTQMDRSINAFWAYDTTDTVLFGTEYQIIDSAEVFDTSFSDPYNVESKLWQQSKAFTIPMEVNYIFDNGYTFGIGFQYQERKKVNKSMGNSTGYSAGDSAWTMFNPDDYSETYNTTTTQLSNSNGSVETQYNRLVYVSISKAPKWSFTITHDWTNAYDASTPVDPYYNPLEALIYGDLKYFTGDRDNIDPPSFIQNRWVSFELAYNVTSSQRLSVMYGSIQGGLFCSNGICRLIPPFNDGLKISYSASF